MKRAISILALIVWPAVGLAQDRVPPQPSAKSFPDPDFVLRDTGSQPQKNRLVLGPMESDGKGETTGSFAVLGGSAAIHVWSLSFSGDGKTLAVGAPPHVDIWDVENRKKLRTFDGGFAAALSSDAHLLATNANGIEICDVATGKVIRTIPWSLKGPVAGAPRTIRQMQFNPSGSLLLVSSNGDFDEVFDVASGQLVATLTHTQQGQFSRDGAFVVGGTAKDLIKWSTKDWTKASDAPNGPDFVMRVANFPEKDLAVVGGLKSARLVHLSNGEEVATVGQGYTNFAAFSDDGTLIFDFVGDGFAVWDTTGKQYCYTKDLGDGTLALSPDGGWLAGAIVNGGRNVGIWNLKNALAACGAPGAPQP